MTGPAATAAAQAQAPDWLAPARTAAVRAPSTPREPLLVAGRVVGSIDPQLMHRIGLQHLPGGRNVLSEMEHSGARAWALPAGDATAALAALAQALRAAGCCGPWRNEQLAVCDAQGERVATVERGAVRVLGVATRAVHLVGRTAGGDLWVQQRAFDKPHHPGQWDTLMGGMVSAADTLPEALARETWEEAGLRIGALQDVAHGGTVAFARPSREGGGLGYMAERIDWFGATLPDGVVPVNQDGEVACFERLPVAEVQARLAQGAFTPEAALVLAGFFGW